MVKIGAGPSGMNCSVLLCVLLLFLPLLSYCYSFDYRTYSGVRNGIQDDM